MTIAVMDSNDYTRRDDRFVFSLISRIESKAVSDHEIEHASIFGLRAEKSLANGL